MGMVLLWKERGLGSQELLGHYKREMRLPGPGRTGIGHTGTLDPFAEGWLLVGTGEGTKLLAALQGLDKTYEARMVLGASTDTFDDTSVARWPEVPELFGELSDVQVAERLKVFLKDQIGPGSQVPPPHSAVHVDGKRSYEWARAGVSKELKARPFEIFEAEHHSYESQSREQGRVGLWTFRLRVSAGTYIRSLARDWGQQLLSTPGYLESLRRSQVGPWGGPKNAPCQPLQMQDMLAFFDVHTLPEPQARALRDHGQWVPRACTKPLLLWGGQTLGVVAFAQAPDGRLGRVFVEDPFQL